MKWLNYILAILLVCLLTGCEGIRGSGGTVEPEPTPVKTNKVIKGKVTKVDLASHEISVNGVFVSLDGAQIIRNSKAQSETDIRAGQIVSIETGEADKKGKYSAVIIQIDDQIQGPISSIDLDARTINVLGQSIHVTSSTSFTSKSFKTLRNNYYVAIFGYRNSNGVVEATLIEVINEFFQAEKDSLKLAGEVNQVDINNGNIVLEGVEIALSVEQVNEIKVGDVISLNGLATSDVNPNTLTVKVDESVIQDDARGYDVDFEIVLEGLPTKITARNMFTLNGYQIIVPEELIDSSISSVENRKLIIEGSFVGGTEVLAKSILIEQIKDFEYRGEIHSNTSSDSFEIFGLTVVTNNFTYIDFNLKTTLESVLAGSKATVYAKGYVDSLGRRVATSVLLNVNDNEQFEIVKGRIEEITDNSILVAGVPVKLNNFLINQNDNVTLNSAEVFALIAVGDRVEFSGGYSSDKVLVSYFIRKIIGAESNGDKGQVAPDESKSPKRR